jgi:hypothetical protein
VVYDELREHGLVVIAVALDAGGADAVRDRVLCPDLAERPDAMRRMMGWPDDLWRRAAPPTYPCLIDTDHTLSELYQMTNVPMAVWIDEQGRIVRPTETAGFGEGIRKMDPSTFELPEDELDVLESNRRTYIDALRDWVRRGADSEFALAPDEVRRRMDLPEPDDVLAATHARLGRHLHETGDDEGAKEHFRLASRLAPGKWNYRRQSMVLDQDLIGQLNTAPEFWAAVMASEKGQLYPAIDMPGMRPH